MLEDDATVWENIQVELYTILTINKNLTNNNSMILKALLDIYHTVQIFISY